MSIFYAVCTDIPLEQQFFSFFDKFGVGKYQFFFGVQEQSCKVPVDTHASFKQLNVQVIFRQIGVEFHKGVKICDILV